MPRLLGCMDKALLDSIYHDFHDDAVFAHESLSIANKLGAIVPLDFGPAQTKLAAIIARQRELGKPVRIIALKARQVWVSTYVAARYWRDTAHRPGQHTYVIAQDLDTASNIFKYYQTFDETYKPFRGVIAKPVRAGDSTKILDYTNKSYIEFHTAGSATTGRSRSIRRVHFSEFAFYGDGARALMGAVMSSVPTDSDTEVIVESTANGLGNEFHTMWQRAVSGESEWVPFFFAWWEHPEYFRALEVAADVFQNSLSKDEQELKQRYNLTLEQLSWRRWKIRNDLNGDEDLFKQEFPSNPEEAFLTSGRPRYDLKSVERMPIVREPIEGGMEMIEMAGRNKLAFAARDKGEIVIFRKPELNREYIIGVDVAEGIDVTEGKGSANPDWSVMQVYDRDTGEQVARFRARSTPSELGWQCYMLAIYYYWAQIVPEANGPGLAFIDSLIGHGYPPGLIYHRIDVADQDPQIRGDKIGFRTTVVTRPQILSLLDEAIRTMAVIIHDAVTIQELRTFIIKPNGRAEHAYNCHDDTVISLALVLIGIQQMPRRPKPKLIEDNRKVINNWRKGRDQSDERGDRVKLL
jgi:hypothetical protein